MNRQMPLFSFSAVLIGALFVLGCGPAVVATASINAPFVDPALDTEIWTGRFEREGREVYAQREAIVAALGIEAGQVVADIGAGTGALSEALCRAVGTEGKVIATELSPVFRAHLKARAAAEGWTQMEVRAADAMSTGLAPESVDRVLLVDVYHHLDAPAATMTELAQALKPGGRLYIIDLDPAAPTAPKWLKAHTQITSDDARETILGTGLLAQIPTPQLALEMNYVLAFQRVD